MISFKHLFRSPKTDGTDTTLVKPSNWNDEHQVLMDEGIMGRLPGTGVGPPVEIPLSSLYYPGMIMMYGGTVAPNGWFICDGQLVSRTNFPALFAVLGTYYGAGDGLLTFGVPDLRGRVPAGVDPGTGRLTGTTIVNPTLPGGAGGQETEQGYADVNISASGRSYGANTSQLQVHVAGATSGVANPNWYGGIVGGGDVLHGDHYHNFDGWFWTAGSMGVYADGTYYGGGGGWTRPTTNVQPTLMVNFIIKS